MFDMVFAIGMFCANVPLHGDRHNGALSNTTRICATREESSDRTFVRKQGYGRLTQDHSLEVFPSDEDKNGLQKMGGGRNAFIPAGDTSGVDPDRKLGMIVALGWACVDDHGNGVWYQEGFPFITKLCTTSWEIGKRVGAWSFGYTRLIRTHSDAIALTEDSNYDIANKRCRMHCDRTVRVISAGKVDGVYLRHEWVYGNLIFEGGGLFFRPEHVVYLSDFGHLNENGERYLKDLRLVHRNKDEYKFSPSIGLGYRHKDLDLMFRYYPWVKSSGDQYEGNGRYKTLTSLYSGPVFQVMLQYRF